MTAGTRSEMTTSWTAAIATAIFQPEATMLEAIIPICNIFLHCSSDIADLSWATFWTMLHVAGVIPTILADIVTTLQAFTLDGYARGLFLSHISTIALSVGISFFHSTPVASDHDYGNPFSAH